MSEIIDITRNSIGNCKFMQHATFLTNILVRTVLTDLLTCLLKIDIHVRYMMMHV